MGSLTHDIVMGMRAALALLATAAFLRVLLQPGSVDTSPQMPQMKQWRRISMLLLMGGLAGISLAHMAAMAYPPLLAVVFYSLLVLASLGALTAAVTMISIWLLLNTGCSRIPIAIIPLAFILIAVIGSTP